MTAVEAVALNIAFIAVPAVAVIFVLTLVIFVVAKIGQWLISP